MEPLSLVGNLRDVGLAEVVQLLSLSGKPAVIDVELSSGQTGVVVLEACGVTYADLGAQLGEEALFEMLALKSGVFRVQVGCSYTPKNIEHTLSFILLEVARRADEMKARRDHPPAQFSDIVHPFEQHRHPFLGFFTEAGVLVGANDDEADLTRSAWVDIEDDFTPALAATCVQRYRKISLAD